MKKSLLVLVTCSLIASCHPTVVDIWHESQEESRRLVREGYACLLNNAVDDCIEMKFVKGDTFTMGCWGSAAGLCSIDEKPAHTVKLSDFWIGKTEVTLVQWHMVMGGLDLNPVNTCWDCPILGATWDDIQLFIKKLNALGKWTYRLPTEAEWEYACRSGGKEEAFGGKPYMEPYLGNTVTRESRKVGQMAPNELGLYDMSGNVWELVQDIKTIYSSDMQMNPYIESGSSFRVIRGGSLKEKIWTQRCTTRYSIFPNQPDRKVGFRLARNA